MNSELRQKICEEYPEIVFCFADGFDDAIIGVDEATWRLIYSVDQCIEILCNRDGMTEEEAQEFFGFNVTGAYVGEKTPIWCSSLLI